MWGFSAVGGLAALLCGVFELELEEQQVWTIALGWAPVSLASIVLWMVLNDREFLWWMPLVLLVVVSGQIIVQGLTGMLTCGIVFLLYQKLKSRD